MCWSSFGGNNWMFQLSFGTTIAGFTITSYDVPIGQACSHYFPRWRLEQRPEQQRVMDWSRFLMLTSAPWLVDMKKKHLGICNPNGLALDRLNLFSSLYACFHPWFFCWCLGSGSSVGGYFWEALWLSRLDFGHIQQENRSLFVFLNAM